MVNVRLVRGDIKRKRYCLRIMVQWCINYIINYACILLIKNNTIRHPITYLKNYQSLMKTSAPLWRGSWKQTLRRGLEVPENFGPSMKNTSNFGPSTKRFLKTSAALSVGVENSESLAKGYLVEIGHRILLTRLVLQSRVNSKGRPAQRDHSRLWLSKVLS